MSGKRKARGPGRPLGRHFTQDIHVRLPEELRSRLVSLKAQNYTSLSKIAREALEMMLALVEQPK